MNFMEIYSTHLYIGVFTMLGATLLIAGNNPESEGSGFFLLTLGLSRHIIMAFSTMIALNHEQWKKCPHCGAHYDLRVDTQCNACGK